MKLQKKDEKLIRWRKSKADKFLKCSHSKVLCLYDNTNIRSELRPSVSALKLSTVVHTCYPRIGEADTGWYPELTDHHVRSGRVSVRGPASKDKMENNKDSKHQSLTHTHKHTVSVTLSTTMLHHRRKVMLRTDKVTSKTKSPEQKCKASGRGLSIWEPQDHRERTKKL